ncbi:MAG: type II/IV secretion system protein [bacterium]|nr:type II/IV secretion system protein [bacterium]
MSADRHLSRNRLVRTAIAACVTILIAIAVDLLLKAIARWLQDPQLSHLFAHRGTWVVVTGFIVVWLALRSGEVWSTIVSRNDESADRDDISYKTRRIRTSSTTDEPVALDEAHHTEREDGSELVEFATPEPTTLAKLSAELTRLACAADPDMVRIIDRTLSSAIARHASDVHIEPGSTGIGIRFRIEGTLIDVVQLPATLQSHLINRLKVMSQLPSFDRGTPHDGRIFAKIAGRQFDIRVSFMPTIAGEKVVLRLLESSGKRFDLEQLGLSKKLAPAYCDALTRPQGNIFVTGPTGSGKTTTMYASLRFIKSASKSMVNIVTIEDPVEYAIPDFSQTQVSEETGLTFAKGLRTILRQDPDVIMVGEIRDRETAEVALQAGMTGHLMLTTVHADSAAGVFSRLINMGIEPFLLASSAAAVLSQRLVRQLCPSCQRPTDLAPSESRLLGDAGIHLGHDATFYSAPGCDNCFHTGYVGRTLLAQLMLNSEALQQAIINKMPTGELTRIATEEGMTSLLENGIAKALQGTTTIAEVLRVTR